MTTPKRTARATWEAIEAQVREDEIRRARALTPAEVDARLRAAGLDPEAIRAEGLAFVKGLIAARGEPS